MDHVSNRTKIGRLGIKFMRQRSTPTCKIQLKSQRRVVILSAGTRYTSSFRDFFVLELRLFERVHGNIDLSLPASSKVVKFVIPKQPLKQRVGNLQRVYFGWVLQLLAWFCVLFPLRKSVKHTADPISLNSPKVIT